VPFRELALLLVIPSICCAALFRPSIGLFGYIWFAVVRPDLMAYCPDKYPFSFALAVATLAGSFRYAGFLPQIFRIPIVQWLLLLQIPIGLSVLFSEGPFLSMDRYVLFERTTIMLLLFPLVLRTSQDLRHLLYTFAFSGAMLGGRLGTFGLLQGGALLNQSYGYVYDNNELALAIAMLMPVCWYCRQVVSSKWIRLGLTLVMLPCAAAVIFSNSRGASIAMGVIFLVLLLKSKRRLPLLICLLLALGPAIYLVRDQYVSRMSTIQHYEDEESAANRVDLWKAALAMWEDYPVVGVGFGGRNFIRLSEPYMKHRNINVVHNSYLQMLVDSGIFAFAIYTGLIVGTILWLGKSVKLMKRRLPDLEYIPLALQAPLIGFAVGSTFYSHQRYDLMYMLLMTAAAWYQIQPRELAAPAAEQAPEEIAALAN